VEFRNFAMDLWRIVGDRLRLGHRWPQIPGFLRELSRSGPLHPEEVMEWNLPVIEAFF
jgi:hypothetical protein